MSERRCAYAPCGKLFAPKAVGQKTCSFRCARMMVPKDRDLDEDVPHPKREARLAAGWLPGPPVPKPSRAKSIADALDELRQINAARLRN